MGAAALTLTPTVISLSCTRSAGTSSRRDNLRDLATAKLFKFYRCASVWGPSSLNITQVSPVLKYNMPRKGSTKASIQAKASTSALPTSLPMGDAQDALVSQKSAFSSSVTLFALDSTNEEGNGLRRSPRKRVKLEMTDETELGQAPDIEDTVRTASGAAKVSPLVALRNRLAVGRTASASVVEGAKTKEGRTTSIKVEQDCDSKAMVPPDSPLSSAPPSPPSSTGKKPIAKRNGKAKAKSENASPVLKTDESLAPTPLASPTKGKGKAKAQKPVPTALATPHPAPEHWEEVYGLIREMRKKIVAPVDTMGCDQAQYKETDPRNRRFATLVSLMLSSQTKDEVTDAAVTKLRTALGGTLNIENMIAADDKVIADAINKVGFWRRKTDYLKQAALKLQSDFNSDLPKTADELCSLPGVGPKMAFLALQVCWDLNLGIGVDVHVHRITNRLGWHKRPTKTPEETRLNLQSWLPKEYHREINHMLVGFGQVVCLPVNPKCGECVLSEKGLCPSARVATAKKTMTKGRKRKVEVEVEESNLESDTVKVELKTEGLLKMEEEVADVKMEDTDS
ncbi:hypothetical protein NMY22_g11489 [Coprinellus aureogranulatus]|nr:hypothetical protein NMY22_g11489 [Coprinellus aureogranulatus]